MAKLEVEGMENLLNEIDKLGSVGDKIKKLALVKAGEKVKDAIISEAPHRTGNLKKNIKVSKLKTKDGMDFVEVYPSKDAFYAPFVEFGTTKVKANPFMSRGYESSSSEAEELIIQEIKKELGLWV